MKKILHWLIPKERELFEMLAQQSENAAEAAKELKNFIDDYHKFERKERKSKANAIKDIEKKGDDIVRGIIVKLAKSNKSSVVKENMRKMAVVLDDLLDLLNAIASRLVIFNIERIDDYIIKLSNIVVDAVNEVDGSIANLGKLKNAEERCAKIRNLERKADEVYEEALSELFHFYKNSIDIMKYKEIYELLERAADKCQDIADIIEDIAAKRA